jgi:hypothetical protein
VKTLSVIYLIPQGKAIVQELEHDGKPKFFFPPVPALVFKIATLWAVLALYLGTVYIPDKLGQE